jgi:hypothetical protein
MATLPDIDTSDVSFIAYWNAIEDGGEAEFDPEELLSHSRIIDYTLYDNGWQGSVDPINSTRPITVRAKTDGWVVGWLDRTRQPATLVSDPPRGPWDVINNWTVRGGSKSLTDNTLAATLAELCTASDTLVAYPANSDFALYNYETPDASYITNLQQGSVGSDPDTYAFAYSEDTTLYDALLAVTSYDFHNVYWNGKDETLGSDGNPHIAGDPTHGAVDLLASSLIPDPGTQYHIYATGSQQGNLVTMWE